jgi:hypothetical protein
MSVANTQYTTNCYRIDISDEFGSNNVIAEVNTAITTLGWSLYDSIDQTTYSPMATRVYRVLNADSITYKYAILRWNTLLLNFNLSTCESWNTSTQTATNESWHNLGCFYQGYDLRDCSIYVSATSRHMVIQPSIRNEFGLWTAVLEFERVAGEDISSNSAPCFAYTNSLMLGTPWGMSSNLNSSPYMFAFPRTPDNQTGAFAVKAYAPVTTRGMYPPYYPSANVANTGANSVVIVNNMDGNNLHLGSYYNTIGSWGWDSTKAVVSPVSVDHIYKSMPFGKIYNAGITKPIGVRSFDTTHVLADSTGGWPSAGGSNTEFLTLTLNGGCEDQFSNAVGRLSVTWANQQSILFGTCIAIGNNVWAAANNGVWTWDMNSGANTTAIQRYVNTRGVIDIMFDGIRSVYGTTNNGFVQIDTETYATNVVTSITDQGGTGFIAMDQKWIYLTGREANTQPKIYLAHKSNNTVEKSIRLGVSTTGATRFGRVIPDYKGFAYSTVNSGNTISTVIRQLVFDSEAANGNTGTTNTTNPVHTVAGNYTGSHYSFWKDYNSDRLFLFTNAGGTIHIHEYANVPNSNTWDAIFNCTITGGAAGTSQMGYVPSRAANNVWDGSGGFVFTPRRGFLHLQPRRVASNAASQTAYSICVSMEHPDNSFGAGTPRTIVSHSTSDVFANTAGFAGNQWTNGVRIFHTAWRANTESRITTLGNLYGNTNFNQYATGRLLIKA